MTTINYVVLIIVVTLSSVASDVTNSTDPCLMERYNGTCKVITNCQYAVSLIIKGDLKLLRNLFCGFEGSDPKVCCPIDNSKTKITYVDPEVTATNRPKTTSRPQTTTQSIHTTTVPSENLSILPNRSVCGLEMEEDKIYGGNIAKMEEFPWLVLIKNLLDDKREIYGCSGSLITNRYVITAAHCTNARITEVRLGDWDINSEIDCYDGQCNDKPVDVMVEQVIVFPGYNRKTLNGDIALLRLQQPVNFTDFVQPICLPTTDYVAMQDYEAESSYVTAGWGKTELEAVSSVKRKVNLKAVSLDVCKAAISRVSEAVTPNIICAGGRKGEDSCRGDSGGPLVRLTKENYKYNWFLFGITSYGAKNCGSEGFPGIYTRVTAYMNWIRQNIRT